MATNPWETPEGRAIWKTEAGYWGFVRGMLRMGWSNYPLRKEWKQRQLRPVTPEERAAKLFHPSTKNVGQCSFCKEWMAGSKLECDHLVESQGCTSKETAESFLWHCVGLIGDDFRLACKPCHKIQSHSQRLGSSFEEAKIAKEVIAICNTTGSKDFLISNGIVPDKNEKLRKIQIRQYLEGIDNE